MDRTKLVPAELEGAVDRAVRELFGTSWGQARAWIGAGKIRVEGTRVTEPTSRVRAGQSIALDLAAPRPRAQGLGDDDVVYVDPHLVVVAKPAGVSTIPYDDSESDTLDGRVRAWLERRHPASRSRGRPNLGVVHRLDKETTGLVVFTRTWLAKQSLTSQFRAHTVHRRYLAIAHGEVREGTITSFIRDDRGDGLRGSARGSVRRGSGEAREAITHVSRVEALAGATLVACRLETGRTHQIRIHLSESGHPLLGEKVYVRGFPGPLLEAPRLMLHAAELGFVHPATEREMRWERAMPDDMRQVLERLQASR
jgi:23S rRNA pseudouridine1911/1915/1917 synthase